MTSLLLSSALGTLPIPEKKRRGVDATNVSNSSHVRRGGL